MRCLILFYLICSLFSGYSQRINVIKEFPSEEGKHVLLDKITGAFLFGVYENVDIVKLETPNGFVLNLRPNEIFLTFHAEKVFTQNIAHCTLNIYEVADSSITIMKTVVLDEVEECMSQIIPIGNEWVLVTNSWEAKGNYAYLFNYKNETRIDVIKDQWFRQMFTDESQTGVTLVFELQNYLKDSLLVFNFNGKDEVKEISHLKHPLHILKRLNNGNIFWTTINNNLMVEYKSFTSSEVSSFSFANGLVGMCHNPKEDLVAFYENNTVYGIEAESGDIKFKFTTNYNNIDSVNTPTCIYYNESYFFNLGDKVIRFKPYDKEKIIEIKLPFPEVIYATIYEDQLYFISPLKIMHYEE